MPLLILLSLLGILYAEFLVFFEVGDMIGGFNALLLTILTAIFGLYLIRQQGLVVIQRLHQNLQEGENPVEEITHGFFLLVAGLFFLLPGFLSDSVAILLAISPLRALLGRSIINNVSNHFYHNGPKKYGQDNYGSDNTGSESIIIEGDFSPVDSEKEESEKNSSSDPKRLDN